MSQESRGCSVCRGLEVVFEYRVRGGKWLEEALSEDKEGFASVESSMVGEGSNQTATTGSTSQVAVTYLYPFIAAGLQICVHRLQYASLFCCQSSKLRQLYSSFAYSCLYFSDLCTEILDCDF